jgi:hypothetical protein
MLSSDDEFETWLLDAADAAIRRKVSSGLGALSDRERALYCLWVADYSMRNAGDLQSAYDLCAEFKSAGALAAGRLGLPFSVALFSLGDGEFVAQYFASFESVCREIANASQAV